MSGKSPRAPAIQKNTATHVQQNTLNTAPNPDGRLFVEAGIVAGQLRKNLKKDTGVDTTRNSKKVKQKSCSQLFSSRMAQRWRKVSAEFRWKVLCLFREEQHTAQIGQ